MHDARLTLHRRMECPVMLAFCVCDQGLKESWLEAADLRAPQISLYGRMHCGDKRSFKLDVDVQVKFWLPNGGSRRLKGRGLAVISL